MKKVLNAVSEYFASLDRWLLFFWLAASAVSVIFLWSISQTWPELYSPNTQFWALGAGMIAALFISLFDHHTLLKLWKLYVPVCFILMILTFFIGKGRGDANRNWIYIQILGRETTIQPSEFLKLAFIVTLSLHISKSREHFSSLSNMILLCLHAGVYIAFMFQDAGSLLVFVFIFITMIFCAGIKWRYIFAGIAATAAAVPLLWYKILSEDQKLRFLVLLNPEISEQYAFQQKWGLVALSVGGMRGTGIFADSHIPVPEIYNDFIFTFIGESGGFIACLGVIFLLSAISLKILYNSGRAVDDSGRFICIGVFAMIVSQTVINLGMCLRLLPVIGVTLPLISSGGTSALALYIALGFVLSVYRRRSTGLFSEKQR